MRVLVTGASGFLGGVTCAEAVAAGHDVLALVRRPGSEPAGTTAVGCDLTDGPALGAAVGEAEPHAVIHLAAEIASQRNAERVRAVNVGGTKALIDACTAAGSPRIVFTSTVVTGDAGGRVLTEDEPLPVATPYGQSKQDCERLLAESGVPHVTIRPSHVYGPGGWYIDELVALLRRPGRFCVVGDGKNLWDVVHVDDVVASLLLALEDLPSGEIFHCVDDEPTTYYDFMELTASTLGLGSPRRIPTFVARRGAGGNAVDALVRSARSSNAKLKAAGWSPRFPTAREGVPDALAGLA